MSFEELLQLFKNALRSIHRQKNVLLAEQIVDLISLEWRRKLLTVRSNERFYWPTTDAPPGLNGISSQSWHKEGMLSTLGYHVGSNYSLSTLDRHRILTYAFEKHLPPINSLEYMAEWGQPGTPRRLRKLSHTIASLTRSARRNPQDRSAAINDWEVDLTFLHKEFYVGRFRFDWPDTLSQMLDDPFQLAHHEPIRKLVESDELEGSLCVAAEGRDREED